MSHHTCVMYVQGGNRALCMFAAVSEFSVLITLEPFSETDIFVRTVCLGYQTVSKFRNDGHQSHIIAHHHVRIKIFLPTITEIWFRTAGRTDGWTDTQDQLLDSPLV